MGMIFPPPKKKMVGNNAHVPYVPAALDGTSVSSERGVRIGTIYVAPWHKELKFWSDTAVRDNGIEVFVKFVYPQKRTFQASLMCPLVMSDKFWQDSILKIKHFDWYINDLFHFSVRLQFHPWRLIRYVLTWK